MQTLKRHLFSSFLSSYLQQSGEMFCLSDHKKIIRVNTAAACMLCQQKHMKDGAQILLDPQCQRLLKSGPPFLSDGWISFLDTLTFGVYEGHDRNQAGWFFHICNGRGCCEMWSLKTLQLSCMLDPFLDGLELGWTATWPNTRQAVSKEATVWGCKGESEE